MDTTPAEQAHIAVEDLLLVIAKAADDLKTFHATVSRAETTLPAFPKATVRKAVEVVEHLNAVEHALRDILIGLGLPERP